jgi:hypothetical protein
MRKIVLVNGLIAGAIMLGMFFIALPFKDALGFDKGMVYGYTSMVAAFLLVYFGIRSYRDNVGGGKVSFGRATAVGMLIVAVASTIYVAGWEIYYFGTNGGQEYVKGYQDYVVAKEKAKGTSEADLAKIVEENKKFAEMYNNPMINSALTFMEPLPVGILIALISAGVLSRRRKQEALA